MPNPDQPDWTPYVERFTNGEWRAPIFRDMILADAGRMAGKRNGGLTFLDIGCGGGFDADSELQHSLAHASETYIGIEPDPEIALSPVFGAVHRCLFEEAPIEPDSIDVAFAVMVLEHLEDPELFWNQVHKVLRPDGGVFWGFTVDARNWFVAASWLTDKLHIKDLYLNMLHGRRGVDRYDNYPVTYKCNSPKQIQEMTRSFASTTCLNFQKVGQVDYYLPRTVRWMSRAFDRLAIRMGLPGTILAVRVEK